MLERQILVCITKMHIHKAPTVSSCYEIILTRSDWRGWQRHSQHVVIPDMPPPWIFISGTKTYMHLAAYTLSNVLTKCNWGLVKLFSYFLLVLLRLNTFVKASEICFYRFIKSNWTFQVDTKRCESLTAYFLYKAATEKHIPCKYAAEKDPHSLCAKAGVSLQRS